MTTTPTGVPIIDCDVCGWRHPIERPHCDTCGKSSRFINEGLCLGCRKAEPGLESVLCSTCGHPYVGHQHPAKAANPERLECHQDCTCEAFVPSTVAIPEPPSPGPRDGGIWPKPVPAITTAEREELAKQARAESQPEPDLCPPCRDTDCNACEGRALLLDCQCAHSILEDS